MFLHLMKSISQLMTWYKRSIQILSCMLFTMPTYAASSHQVTGYVMHVQITPAICALDQSKQKQRQCLEGYSLTIAGLMPEVHAGQNCTAKTAARLSPIQEKVVSRVMPEEQARIQLWQEVGGCVPMSASQYFRTMINFAERLKIPANLTSAETVDVNREDLIQQFRKLNPALPSNGIQLSCQSSRFDQILTEVQICYQRNGKYKQCAQHVMATCPNEFTIKGSY